MMTRFVLALLMVFALPTFAAAQFTIPYTFSPNTRAQSAQVNANFSILTDALNRTGGTMTGTLTTQNVLPDSNNTRDLGSNAARYANLYSVLGNFSGNLVVGGSITAGSGAVTIVGADGRIPELSSTYFASLDASNLVNIPGDRLNVTTVTTAYTALTTDDVIQANGTFTITLFPVSGNSGKVLEIKNIGTGVVTIDGNASETIDGEPTFALEGQYFSVTLFCDGTKWVIL